jgi:hypothetical protein
VEDGVLAGLILRHTGETGMADRAGAAVFRWTARVRFGDTDRYGVVYPPAKVPTAIPTIMIAFMSYMVLSAVGVLSRPPGAMPGAVFSAVKALRTSERFMP